MIHTLRVPYNSPIRIDFDYVVGGVGQEGKTVYAAIRRFSDNYWWDEVHQEWQGEYDADCKFTLGELDDIDLPGHYYTLVSANFDFPNISYLIRIWGDPGDNYILVVVDPEIMNANIAQIGEDGDKAIALRDALHGASEEDCYIDSNPVRVGGDEDKLQALKYAIVPEYQGDENELIANGGFDADEDWEKYDGATISDGVGNLPTGGASRLQQQNIPVEVGKTYIFKLTVAGHTVRPGIQGVEVLLGEVVGPGTHEWSIVSDNSTFLVVIYSGLTGDSTIDNVSLQEAVLVDGKVKADAVSGSSDFWASTIRNLKELMKTLWRTKKGRIKA